MSAIPNEGTTFSVDGTDVGTLLAVTPPGYSVAAVEKTVLSDTMKKYRPSRQKDAGEVTVTVQYDPAGEISTLISTVGDGDEHDFVITYNDGQTTAANDTFSGFVTEHKPGAMEGEGNRQDDFTIKLTTAITRNAGTA